MVTIEGFAWDYTDLLKLNRNYRIPDKMGEFAMADIGTYSHTEIQLCWTGISIINMNYVLLLSTGQMIIKLKCQWLGLTQKAQNNAGVQYGCHLKKVDRICSHVWWYDPGNRVIGFERQISCQNDKGIMGGQNLIENCYLYKQTDLLYSD